METAEFNPAIPRIRMAEYLELTKPRITCLVLITTFVGFYMGSREGVGLLLLIHTILGTALVAGGASAFNQYMERDLDGRMPRTQNRPLPDGRLTPREAVLFSTVISLAGTVYLGLFVNGLTAMLGVLTLTVYAFVYTPLKTRTSLCTMVGAVAGAIPPMIGWTAAGNEIGAGALALFAILFLWQIPHFLAIAWLFTEDYTRAGFRVHTRGANTGRQIVFFCSVLIPISLVPTLAGVTGIFYMAGAILSSLVYLRYGFAVARF
ncbi:MAG: protoheme IX farnesyltransferase [Acidobacteria bacterium]|nr:protoheme IX farnesyltransferase [Acidobacteriota bacterium]